MQRNGSKLKEKRKRLGKIQHKVVEIAALPAKVKTLDFSAL